MPTFSSSMTVRNRQVISVFVHVLDIRMERHGYFDLGSMGKESVSFFLEHGAGRTCKKPKNVKLDQLV